jgi:hypothetical protein
MPRLTFSLAFLARYPPPFGLSPFNAFGYRLPFRPQVHPFSTLSSALALPGRLDNPKIAKKRKPK